MAIVRMKRLKLLAVKSQREEIFRELLMLGCVEVTEPEVAEDDELLAGLERPDGTELLRERTNQTTLQNAIRLLDRYAPAKKKMLQPLPDIKREALLDESKLQTALETAGEIISLDEQIRRITADESRERTFIESLNPWRELDMPLEFEGTESVAAILGTVPAGTEPGRLEAAISGTTERAELLTVSSDAEQKYLLLICLKEEQEELLAAVRACGFAAASVGDNNKGTAKENIEQAEKRLADYAEEKKALSEQIAAKAAIREDLKVCADITESKIAQAEADTKLLCTVNAFALEGWIPAEEEAHIAEALSKYACAWETEDPDPEKPEEVPVKLKGNALTRPFNMVTGMYSFPAYNGIDPNPFLVPTFALFFGIMFADIGYGLIMLLAGLFLKFKVRPRGTFGQMSGLAIICGISCIIFGLITGGFFGDIVVQVSQFFGGSAALPSVIDPLKDPMTILIICIAIGVVHMLIGVGINAYMLIREKKFADAFWDAGTVYLVFIGIALGVLGVTWIVCIIAVVLLIYAQGRGSKSIVGIIGGGLYGLYNFVSGWFGDILSYSRLMALMLAGTVVAQVFNTLGAMTGNVITFAIIFILGQALNFGLNVIGTYVHTSRLEYLEFFGKFYREGGRPFSPLELKSKYYNICN